ncbi:MAG: sigma-54-dependent Fis family transcriptional regulator [Deltaproteobacteria bacterium]|nr:sigma-54-dependent Fis family transcriptional regulator [Deltaproteobacteria bacterium]
MKVLVVDDEPYMLQAWKKILEGHECEIRTLSDAGDVLSVVERWRPDVTVMDIRMPQVSGIDLLRQIKSQDLPTEVVMMTAYATVETAVEAVKSGAYDYLTKPFSNIEAAALTVLKAGRHKRLVQRNRELESMLDVRDSFEGLVGSSPQMERVFELIDGVAYSSSTILVQGESGTGKELVARAIHHRSPRRARPFVAVNCAALTDTLLESELFGHEKGSFTGATRAKRGLFEVADGGSIFLDEIGQVPQPTQVKLLRVLQEGELKRVGSSEIRSVDVRVITATHVDLVKATQAGEFREDLFYRLNVITITLPPLRERTEDIPLLALHFLRKHNARTGKNLEGISPEAMEILERYSWQGNVRELENVIERAVVLGRGREVEARDLPESMRGPLPPRRETGTPLAELPYRKAKEIALGEFDRRYMTEILSQTSGNVSQASRRAGMDRSNFRRVMKRYNMDPADFSASNQLKAP